MESLIDYLVCDLAVGDKSDNFLAGRHILDNPKYLPCCQGKACNKCIVKFLLKRRNSGQGSEVFFSCPLCQKTSKISMIGDECDLEYDDYTRGEYERKLININHYLIKKLETNLKNVEDRFQFKENYLNKRKAYIENEIHDQVEALKVHLDDLEAEMKANLDVSTKNMIQNLHKLEKANQPCLNEMKIRLENLKTNAFSYANGGDAAKAKQNGSGNLNLTVQSQSVSNCVSSLNQLNQLSHTMSDMISELKFDPNVELPLQSVIGTLKEINDTDLKEQFKTIKSQTQIAKMCSLYGSNQMMPISPRYMCIADPSTLLFTDSQTKQLIQIKLDSGEVVRSTNLNGQLKNPDGVAVNPTAGCIYVSDSELRLIFKLDYQFNILKKFGFRDLKWPRGLFYDHESTYPTDGINPNRLYICDPSNQFIAIYNDHEQLRDCLTLSVSDEPLPSYSKANEMLEIKGNSGGQVPIEEELKFCPLNVFVNRTNIYVTDDWTGGNCIRIFDKWTHKLLRNVGDLNAWNPLGLLVDDMGNLFTMARLYYETGSAYLFCFNKDGDLAYKTNLNISNECISDIVLDKYTDKFNYRIICSGDKKIHYLKF